MASALEGVRVVDLSQWEAGPSCTETLAWLGAEVIKIEPLTGEPGRRSGAGLRQGQTELDAYYFLLLNANKKSVAVNLRTDEGRAIVRRLCETADVFVENFAPGVIERIGFDYETLRALNERLIYAQVKGFSPDGPYADFLCFDRVAQAVGGAMSTTGLPSGPPLTSGPTFADEASGLNLTLGILAALYQRAASGKGQKVHVAMQEATIALGRVTFAQTLMTGTAAVRRGNGFAMSTAPADIYVCKPGGPNDFVMIYTSRASVPVQWERLLNVVGRPELKGDPRFATPESRAEHAAEIDEIVSAWSAGLTKREAMEALGRAGVPAGAVFDTLELSEDPALRTTGIFAEVDHPTRGSFAMPTCPIRLSDSHVPVTPAPLLGQHTRQVLGAELDMTDEQIEKLQADGVLLAPPEHDHDTTERPPNAVGR